MITTVPEIVPITIIVICFGIVYAAGCILGDTVANLILHRYKEVKYDRRS